MKPETKAWMERQKLLGEATQIPKDVVPFGDGRVRMLAETNKRREAAGRPPFENDEAGNPQLTEERRRRYEQFKREEAKGPRSISIRR